MSNGRSIRLAHKDDMELLFDWGNDRAVRQNAVNMRNIDWEEHREWFLNILKSPLVRIYILETEGQPVGQVRLEYMEGGWRISYDVDRSQRGKGYGTELIRFVDYLLKSGDLGKEALVWAQVKKVNVTSQKIFEKLGYVKTECEDLLVYKKSGG